MSSEVKTSPVGVRRRKGTLASAHELAGSPFEADTGAAGLGSPIRTPSPATSSRSRPRSRRKVSRREDSKGVDDSSTKATWVDMPLAVALIPPIGSFLTGSELLRDFLLFLLLVFYLHQLIKLPWDLYVASRPRSRHIQPSEDPVYNLAVSELRIAEFIYLALSVFTPLLGACLLRYVGTALTGKDYISWFSTGVFILVTGIRPWRHLALRLRGRTEDLQDLVRFSRAGEDLNALPVRIGRLESELEALRGLVALRDDVQELRREVEDSLDVFDETVGKNARMAELGKRATEERLAAIERTLDNTSLSRLAGHGQPSVSSVLWALFKPTHPPLRPSLSKNEPSSPPGGCSPPRQRTHSKGYRPLLPPVTEEGPPDPPLPQKPRSSDWIFEIVVLPLSGARMLLFEIWNFLERHLL